ncbi:MAG: HNH endonuclease [Acholeplasmatales bacterium]|nr:HNH endonuclease [Acholeplasmatales bacterium]
MKRGEGYIAPENSRPGLYFEPLYEERIHFPYEEIFIDISTEHFPEIKQYYLISNYGRIYHKILRSFLNINIDSKGYSYKPLATIYGQRNYRVHRLLMESFAYVPGCEELTVNHKNGIKNDNMITNLEWATFSENIKHAWETNLRDRVWSLSDEEIQTINNICIDLQNGTLQSKEIANKYNVSINLVDSIKYGRAHINISSNYNFNANTYEVINEDDVRRLCEYFQNNPTTTPGKKYYQEALYGIGKNIEINPALIQKLRNIYFKKTFKEITSQYNY